MVNRHGSPIFFPTKIKRVNFTGGSSNLIKFNCIIKTRFHYYKPCSVEWVGCSGALALTGVRNDDGGCLYGVENALLVEDACGLAGVLLWLVAASWCLTGVWRNEQWIGSEEDISKSITKGNSKSCSLDQIPTTLLKGCLPVLLFIILSTNPNSRKQCQHH